MNNIVLEDEDSAPTWAGADRAAADLRPSIIPRVGGALLPSCDAMRKKGTTDAQREEARFSADLQARRFEAGVGDYVSYLDALRALYQVESALSSAGRTVAISRLGIHRALGGDWATPSAPDWLAPNPVEMVPAPQEGQEP